MNYDMPEDHGDETLIILNRDQQFIAVDACNELIMGIDDLRKDLIVNKLKTCNRFNVLSVMADHLKRLGRATGQEVSINQELDLCHKQIREANQEIHDLHQQLATATPLDGLGDFLYSLDKQVEEYWKSLGFTLTEGKFDARWRENTRYCVKLSCFIDVHGSSFSETPATDKENAQTKIEEMKLVMDLLSHDHDRDHYFLDTPRNRTYLINKMRERFPSFRVFEWDSRACPYKTPDMFYIPYVQAMIELKDFKDEES